MARLTDKEVIEHLEGNYYIRRDSFMSDALEKTPYSEEELEVLRLAALCPVCRKRIEGIAIDGLCSDICCGKWDSYNRRVR